MGYEGFIDNKGAIWEKGGRYSGYVIVDGVKVSLELYKNKSSHPRSPAFDLKAGGKWKVKVEGFPGG